MRETFVFDALGLFENKSFWFFLLCLAFLFAVPCLSSLLVGFGSVGFFFLRTMSCEMLIRDGHYLDGKWSSLKVC